MTLEIVAPAALVVLGAVILTYTQFIAPRRARQHISRSLIRQGWMRAPFDRDYTWTSIMTLAIGDQQGTSQVREYDPDNWTVHGPCKENREMFRKSSGVVSGYEHKPAHLHPVPEHVHPQIVLWTQVTGP